MATITKTYRFEAAHSLPGHKGKCATPHGHSYRVDVAITGQIRLAVVNGMLTSSDGMVMDFDDIDVVMKPLVDHANGYLDHHNLNETLTGIPRTTAELIGCWIGGSILKTRPDFRTSYDLRVRVWETPSCSAEVGERDITKWGLGVDVHDIDAIRHAKNVAAATVAAARMP